MNASRISSFGRPVFPTLLPLVTVLLCGLLASELEADIIPGSLPDGSNFEYSLETDKIIYQLGETVYVTHTITNPFDVPVDVGFVQEPGFDLWVMQGDSTIYVEYPFALLVTWTRTFEPGEILEFDYTWDMTDRYGNAVLPGEYELIGVVHGGGKNISTNITIIPEPATMVCFTLGGLWLLRRNQICRKLECM